MEPMAAEYVAKHVRSVFVYVREAHPGEFYPHHDSFERKVAHAREFRRVFEVRRPILVDDMVGTAHRGFGGMPNMTYVLDVAHRIVFRSAWTDPPSVRWALDYLLDVQARRREGARLAPFYAEVQGYRWIDDPAFQAGLARNGPKAVREFAEALRMWQRGEHLGAIDPSRRKRQADSATASGPPR